VFNCRSKLFFLVHKSHKYIQNILFPKRKVFFFRKTAFFSFRTFSQLAGRIIFRSEPLRSLRGALLSVQNLLAVFVAHYYPFRTFSQLAWRIIFRSEPSRNLRGALFFVQNLCANCGAYYYPFRIVAQFAWRIIIRSKPSHKLRGERFPYLSAYAYICNR
jgi:hypothetical protein